MFLSMAISCTFIANDLDSFRKSFGEAVASRRRISSYHATFQKNTLQMQGNTAIKQGEVLEVRAKGPKFRCDTTFDSGKKRLSCVNCVEPGTFLDFFREKNQQVVLSAFQNYKGLDFIDPLLIGFVYMPEYLKFGTDFFSLANQVESAVSIGTGPRERYRLTFKKSKSTLEIEIDNSSRLISEIRSENSGFIDLTTLRYTLVDSVWFLGSYRYQRTENGILQEEYSVETTSVLVNVPIENSMFEFQGFDLEDETHISIRGPKQRDLVWSKGSLITYADYNKANEQNNAMTELPILVGANSGMTKRNVLIGLAIASGLGAVAFLFVRKRNA